MNKNSWHNVFKITIVSVLSIGLFSGIFMIANRTVFSQELTKIDLIPFIVHETDAAPTAHTEPQAYMKPTLAVSETVFALTESGTPIVKNPNAISAEEAAEIGAQYIWDVLGLDINGWAVDMNYSAIPSRTTVFWHGYVADSKENLEIRNYPIAFSVDALTGQRSSLTVFNRDEDQFRVHGPEFDSEARIKEENAADIAADQKYRYDHEEAMLIATGYAQKHFENAAIVDAVYQHTTVDLDVNKTSLYFLITDEYERCVEVRIVLETGDLISLLSRSQTDNQMPGYYYPENTERTVPKEQSL